MRDQLIVIIAVSVATIAVAGNVLAQTRAADQRAEIKQEVLAAAWSYPAIDATTSTEPSGGDGPASRQAEGEGGTDSTDPDGAATSCSRRSQCASEEEPSRSFMNHGRMVSEYIHTLGFEEGVDGPRGSYISQIARPDIENDGPPRSERAEENQDKRDETAPPGQDKSDETAPPGQGKKDTDG